MGKRATKLDKQFRIAEFVRMLSRGYVNSSYGNMPLLNGGLVSAWPMNTSRKPVRCSSLM